MRGIGFFPGPDCGDGGPQVFQRQIKLVGIGLPGFAAEGGLIGASNRFLQPFDRLVFANLSPP
ncbi:hypothetical protein ASD12_28090 [Mesorhizobium sp. Root102]|nr:hypothetical protein ASD12_28090 [Mesorhizobium sp. Root102]